VDFDHLPASWPFDRVARRRTAFSCARPAVFNEIGANHLGTKGGFEHIEIRFVSAGKNKFGQYPGIVSGILDLPQSLTTMEEGK
jgi:hypothetical protein